MISTVSALVRSMHAGPSVAVTTISTILAIGIGLEPWRVALIAVVILTGQASVGISNDWLDAARDREVGRTDKPVATGELPTRTAGVAAVSFAIASVLLSIPLGVPALLAGLVFLASGWVYNLRLKSTLFSALPYIVGFGSLPLVVTLARPEPSLAAWWVVLAGALLGLAAHFANVVPDIEDDHATGVAGLPQLIGVRGSGVVVAIALSGAAVSLVAGPGDPQPLRVAGLVIALALAAACVLTILLRPASRWSFRLTMVAAIVAVVLLVSSGSGVLA